MKIQATLKSVKQLHKQKDNRLNKKVVVVLEIDYASHSERSMLFVRSFEKTDVLLQLEKIKEYITEQNWPPA